MTGGHTDWKNVFQSAIDGTILENVSRRLGQDLLPIFVELHWGSIKENRSGSSRTVNEIESLAEAFANGVAMCFWSARCCSMAETSGMSASQRRLRLVVDASISIKVLAGQPVCDIVLAEILNPAPIRKPRSAIEKCQ
jgi:hypothetical protein